MNLIKIMFTEIIIYATELKSYKPQHLPTSWEAQQQKQDFVAQPEHWQDVSDSL
jgi:hypothetical protein